MSALKATLGRRRALTVAVAREALHLRKLPPRVARFYVRAWVTALRTRDRFTLDSASRPSDTSRLLALARGHTATVELGTGTAWTTIALALADPARRVVSYDPEERTQRERYLRLIPSAARARIDLRTGAAESGAAGPGARSASCSSTARTTARRRPRPSTPGAQRSPRAASWRSTTTTTRATPACARPSSNSGSTAPEVATSSCGVSRLRRRRPADRRHPRTHPRARPRRGCRGRSRRGPCRSRAPRWWR